ncbi:MAG: YihY/virulence factor BrkB family protein [Chitinophagaceae bacterium]|jgi:membrane protein|nr:YihY/virulence factor BrkB family protein [Chitinophagaceae bacterium]
MKIHGKIKAAFFVMKKTFSHFMEDKAMKLSASLSYYTVFSLGPVLVIIFSVVSLVFGKAAVEGKVYAQIKDLVGERAALQVQEIMGNVSQSGDGVMGAVIAGIVLVITASAVFIEIQDSMNYILSVKSKPKKGWVKMLVNRLLSFSLLVSIGFLLLVALLVSALVELLGDQLKEMLPDISLTLIYIINIAVVLIVITCLFAIIFKVLPDAKIGWKDAFIGAGFTALLFIIGKFLIGLYLGNSDISKTYGAAASIMILFLWVYYSSMILYLGAEFTKVYATHHGDGIHLKKSAVFIIKQESEKRS